MAALEIYRQALHLTDGMKQAAATSDWQQLVELEQARSDVLAEASRQAISAEERQAVADIIRSMLQLDAQTEQLTAAWIGELRGMFSSMNNERRLLKSYLA